MQIDLGVEKVTKKFKDFTAVKAVSFEVEQGRFFSILGPSGCGKTTLLRMIAGLAEPDNGRITIRGLNMAGIPPNKRPANLVFQHLALFPMMNVADNIAFGLQRRGEKKATVFKKVSAILERVDLPGFEKKKIHELSGGQKQRVAIARCLVLEPAVLLLDEPLGALDLKLREQMKVELKKLQAKVGTTFVYITHDQSEALVMSDQVAVMNKGHFEQLDTPKNLYNRPATPFVARFVGDNNIWSGHIRDRDNNTCRFETPDGNVFHISGDQPWRNGAAVDLFLRPEAMIIQPDPAHTGLNRFEAHIRSLLFDGANSRIIATPKNSDRELLVALPQNRQHDDLCPGDIVEIGWDKSSGICFATETETSP
ncbi:MAG: ABC transporter ATP-binding protein [Desulfobacteraceae bacterium]|nr:ABC transporter ATP-binding protein [Desulfobacteraceae bacterium]